MTHRRFTPHPLVLRRLTVLRATDVTPRMRRVTLGGPQLLAFERDGLRHPAFASPMFDDHVKLLFATEGPVEPVLPVQLAHGIDWPPAPTRAGRDYTPRRVGDGELDLDFVLHAGDDEPGPAEAWARRAAPGAELWAVGPKSSTVVPEDADGAILIGDETALPAIGRFFEERPIAGPAHAIIAVGDPSARQELALRADDLITWVVARPGDPEALERAVIALGDAPFAGRPYVWAGAESRALLPVRRLLSRTHGVPRSRLDITGYWHARDVGQTDATAAAGAAHTTAGTPVESPAAWFAVRAALQLGVFDAAEGTGSSLSGIAEAVGTDAGALGPLLDLLVSRGYLSEDGGLIRLADAGMELMADEHERERFDGFEADRLLALHDLVPALRGTGTAWAHRHGGSLAVTAEHDDGLRGELAEQAGGLAYLMPALRAASPWPSGARLTARGPGAEVVADALRSAGDDAPFAVVEGAADVEIHAQSLTHRTDDEVRAYLAGIEGVSQLILIEPTRADALSPHAAEEGLLHLAVTGSARRSADRLRELAAEAGWDGTGTHELGWGVTCLVLRSEARVRALSS